MTAYWRQTDGEFVFRRLPNGFVQVAVLTWWGERPLLPDEPRVRAYMPSTRLEGANVALATDLIADLTGQRLLAAQLGERLARKLALTFATRASIDGLRIARRAVWQWVRWALTHPVEPPAESPLGRRQPSSIRRDAGFPLARRRQAIANPLHWAQYTLSAEHGASSASDAGRAN